eukprot:1586008-Pyramimonas_sp.AAC.1
MALRNSAFSEGGKLSPVKLDLILPLLVGNEAVQHLTSETTSALAARKFGLDHLEVDRHVLVDKLEVGAVPVPVEGDPREELLIVILDCWLALRVGPRSVLSSFS